MNVAVQCNLCCDSWGALRCRGQIPKYHPPCSSCLVSYIGARTGCRFQSFPCTLTLPLSFNWAGWKGSSASFRPMGLFEHWSFRNPMVHCWSSINFSANHLDPFRGVNHLGGMYPIRHIRILELLTPCRAGPVPVLAALEATESWRKAQWCGLSGEKCSCDLGKLKSAPVIVG